ncbi:MAG: hypothetical protein KBD21_04790 [Candidatus Pacebacteria bacterium]|nr:hypothetical protein [Candidatus Paceibacterota bacterium]
MNRSSRKTATLLTLALVVLFGASFVPVTSYAVGGTNGNSVERSDSSDRENDKEDKKDRDDKEDKNDRDEKEDKKENKGKGGYGGGQISKVDVCRATGSRFLPYVKVTVPASVASVWVSTGVGVYPVNGKCPKGVSVRDYVRDLLSSLFGRNK